VTHPAEVQGDADSRGQGNGRQRGNPQSAPRRRRGHGALPPARRRKLVIRLRRCGVVAGVPGQFRSWRAPTGFAAGNYGPCVLASEGEEPRPQPIRVRQRRLRGDKVSRLERRLRRVQLGWRFPPAEFELRGGQQRRRLVGGHAQDRSEILAVNAVAVDQLENLAAVWQQNALIGAWIRGRLGRWRGWRRGCVENLTRAGLSAREVDEPGPQLIGILQHGPRGVQCRLGHGQGYVLAADQRAAVLEDSGCLALQRLGE
jgi:hypothetical protein